MDAEAGLDGATGCDWVIDRLDALLDKQWAGPVHPFLGSVVTRQHSSGLDPADPLRGVAYGVLVVGAQQSLAPDVGRPTKMLVLSRLRRRGG